MQHFARQNEHHGFGGGVADEVQQHRKHAKRPQPQANAHQPRMLNARISQHALVVVLDHEAECRKRQRQHAERDEQLIGEGGAERRVHHDFPADDGVERNGEQHA